MTPDTLLATITSFYLSSRDFNGLPTNGLELPEETLRILVRNLVRDGLIAINFGDIQPNPHVLALDPESLERQPCARVALAISHLHVSGNAVR